MSLFDVDKSSENRTSPLPNTPDQLLADARKAHGTTSVNYITDASSDTTAAKNGQFTIVQVGDFTSSQTYTTTNPGAGNYVSDTFNIYQVAHGLSYLPGLLAYELSGSGQYSNMPYGGYETGSGVAVWYTFLAFVDTTNFYLQLRTLTYGNGNAAFNPGFIFKWYLLQQTAS